MNPIAPVTDETELRETVREKYAASARRVASASVPCCGDQPATSCCGATAQAPCCDSKADPITGNLYSELDMAELPSTALLASLGCGNPTALAELKAGERVLDLGSGGGIDVLLSARRVGPTGFAYGLDMTDEMLALANQNKAEAGAANVDVPQGAHRSHSPARAESMSSSPIASSISRPTRGRCCARPSAC